MGSTEVSAGQNEEDMTNEEELTPTPVEAHMNLLIHQNSQWQLKTPAVLQKHDLSVM